MSDIPLVWLCGPPGVGKTTVAWAVYQRLVEGRIRAAYVDVDQLGMCYPEPRDDPGRHRLKARNVRALRENFAAAGGTCLIVSGVVEPDRGPDMEVIGGSVVVVRLRAEAEQLVARLRTRRGSFADPAAAVKEADRLDVGAFAHWCVDTTTLSAVETADRVLNRVSNACCRDDPSRDGPRRRSPRSIGKQVGGEVLWLTGPTGVGKSTVGFRAYLSVIGGGVPAAFVDVDQFGFFGEARNHHLRALNLAVVWKNHHNAGAKALVVVGPIELSADMNLYEQVLPNATFTWCRLHASPAELTRRILSRRGGGSWEQPGDPLKGQPLERLTEIAQQATSETANLNQSNNGLRVDVDDLSPDDAANALLEQASWPTCRRSVGDR